MRPGTTLRAAELTTLCEAGLVALQAGRDEEVLDLTARLKEQSLSDSSGSPDEIEAALDAIGRLHDAVAAAAKETADELSRIRGNRSALDGYRRTSVRDPRAVDVDA
jgi:hypothetical protein